MKHFMWHRLTVIISIANSIMFAVTGFDNVLFIIVSLLCVGLTYIGERNYQRHKFATEFYKHERDELREKELAYFTETYERDHRYMQNVCAADRVG